MQVYWTVVVATASLGTAVRAAIITSEARATGRPADGYTPVHGYPISVGTWLFGEPRGVLEYSLAAAPAQFKITSLSLEIRTTFPMSLPFRANVHLFADDGQVDASDFQRTELLVGSTPNIELAEWWYTVSITNLNAINSALGFGTFRHLGLVLVSTSNLGTLEADKLTITWVAVPSPSTVLVLALGAGVGSCRRRRG